LFLSKDGNVETKPHSKEEQRRIPQR